MKFLEKLCASSDIETLWLDLLSQLEFVGLRKIVKANSYADITLSTLQHAAEEASHAYLLKGLAGESRWSQNPLSEAGWMYFQTLDQTASAHPRVKGREYPVVSRLVEERVLKVYPAYLAATRRDDVKRVLRRILAQEKKHHDLFEGIDLGDAAWAELRLVEEALWDRLEAAIHSACERYGIPESASFQAFSRASCTSNQSDAGSRF